MGLCTDPGRAGGAARSLLKAPPAQLPLEGMRTESLMQFVLRKHSQHGVYAQYLNPARAACGRGGGCRQEGASALIWFEKVESHIESSPGLCVSSKTL